MKTLIKFIIIISIILLILGCSGKPTLVNTIEKVTKIQYIPKTSYSGSNAIIIYTKDKVYIYENISSEGNDITIGGTTYVYSSWSIFSFKSEKIK